jgi:hypothetical protein
MSYDFPSKGAVEAAERDYDKRKLTKKIAALEARCAEMETTINMLVHSLLDERIQGGALVLLTDPSPAYDTAK